MKREIVRIRCKLVLLVSLGLAIALAMGTPALAASIYEYYNTGDNISTSIYSSIWRGQTFTPSVAHTITSVKLKLYRIGAAPGTVTVGIRATSGGQPTGGDLCSGTIDGNTLTTLFTGAWYEITLGSGYDLSAGTKYAIVVGAPSSDAFNYIRWRMDTLSPTYGGGWLVSSGDGGSSWTSTSIYDLMFEEWGNPAPGAAVGWETYPTNKVRVLLPWIVLGVAIVTGATLLVLKRRRAQT